jgi:hypothetical protein
MKLLQEIRVRVGVRLEWTFSRLSDIFHGLVYVDQPGRVYLRIC